jgi:hypothetical protein
MNRAVLISSGNEGFGLAGVIALLTVLQSKPRTSRPPTEREAAALAAFDVRQRWNDEVDARKAAKQTAKGSQS